MFSESSAMKIAACGCSVIGSSSSTCDIFGKCPCKVGYSGKKCDQCQIGYTKDRSGACIGIYLCFFFLPIYITLKYVLTKHVIVTQMDQTVSLATQHGSATVKETSKD